jgi:hypothetical protein
MGISILSDNYSTHTYRYRALYLISLDDSYPLGWMIRRWHDDIDKPVDGSEFSRAGLVLHLIYNPE